MSRKALCPAWRMPRFPIMRRVSPSGVLPLCLDQAAIGRHNHEDRVWLICEQDDGSEQPAPLESAENGNAPEEPSDDGEARLHRWGRLARRLAPSWWWLGRRTRRWPRRRTWPTRGRNSHSSLLQLSLLLQLPVSLWVSVPVWVCSRARLWLWLRPLLRSIALRGARSSPSASRK